MVKVTITRDRSEDRHDRGTDYSVRDGALHVNAPGNESVAVYPSGEWAKAVVEK